MEQELLNRIARMVDISGVRTDVTLTEMNWIVQAAKHYRFICAFVMPCFTGRLVQLLRDEPDIRVGGTVGFPSGADTTAVKVACAREMLAVGADELDMVINVGALKSGLYDEVYRDVRAVVDAAEGKPTKCILEIAYLTDDEIRRGAELAVKAGVQFVKTGTGWADKPTTVESIRLIRDAIGDSARIKAAGGVRTLDAMLSMIDAGCSRFGIGLRSIMTIMKEVDKRLGRDDPFRLETSGTDRY
ncbi:MAG: deoxyribose-phosphate aldolase [Clostridiales bacterium]|nr:deoxyribose-phosphate aldolase [Clostridiales bacterium]